MQQARCDQPSQESVQYVQQHKLPGGKPCCGRTASGCRRARPRGRVRPVACAPHLLEVSVCRDSCDKSAARGAGRSICRPQHKDFLLTRCTQVGTSGPPQHTLNCTGLNTTESAGVSTLAHTPQAIRSPTNTSQHMRQHPWVPVMPLHPPASAAALPFLFCSNQHTNNNYCFTPLPMPAPSGHRACLLQQWH